ncbi:zinc-ribbon domain-containing protein [Desulfobulbus oligotrophicus]|uniref:Zinc-ribbon domain-containing protein n=1 Tax=Desulfobulbus oligotrophicus TaxID=1909699 RepID=A0A7T5VE52_9BACT|nr:zinc-ribbon domain-containing protein [Desulfobulbus oligotrophicus]
MLAICEECSKKYNVDESKMKGDRARFSCQECGHIIVVVRKRTGHVTDPVNASEQSSLNQ